MALQICFSHIRYNDMIQQGQDGYVLPAIRRTAQLLQLVADCPEGVSAVELIDRANLPSSSAYRILRSMVVVGFLHFSTETKTYHIGNSVKAYGMPSGVTVDVANVAAPFIDDLCREISETVKLSEIRGTEVEVTYASLPTSSFRIAVDVGTRFPLHAGAASKLLLAFSPEETQREYMQKHLKQYTDATLSTREEIESALRTIRRELRAEDNEEYVDGIGAVAFPVLDARHRVVAALSVAYLVARSRRSTKESMIGAAAFETAIRISRALGAKVREDGYPETIHRL